MFGGSFSYHQQWCDSLPTCCPAHIPCKFTNVRYNNQEASNISNFCLSAHPYHCANSQLIQRIRQKVNLYQTLSSNDTHQVLQRLTNIIKQHVPDFVFHDNSDNPSQPRVNQDIQRDVPAESTGVVSKSRSPFLLPHNSDIQNIDGHTLLKDSSYHSRSTKNGSILGTPMYGGSSPSSPTPSLQPPSKVWRNNYEQTGSKTSRDDYSDQIAMMNRIPMRSASTTSHLSQEKHDLNRKKLIALQTSDPLSETTSRSTALSAISVNNDQANSNPIVSASYVNDYHHLDSDELNGTIDSKNSSVRLPSPNPYPVDRSLSTKQITPSRLELHEPRTQTSTLSDSRQSSSSNASQYSHQLHHTLRESDESIDRSTRKDHHPQSPRPMRDDKIEESNSWLKKFARKVTPKYPNVTSVHNASPSKSPHRYKIGQRRIDVDDLHTKEAMTALEPDLTKEAIQMLIHKKKDCEQNRLMYILSAPSRCCRSCRTQRRLATVAQHSIDIAIKK